jgi:hypothetical protein
MFKNVFSKLFRPSAQPPPSATPTNNIYNGQNRKAAANNCYDPYHNAKYDRAPAIATISESFQASGNKQQANESVENASQRSTSSISSSSSTSYTNNNNNNNQQNSNSRKPPPQAPKSKSTHSMGTARLNESSIQQIYIAPHCIHYTNSTSDDTVYRIDDESLNEIAAEILESDNSPPKLQIVHYGDRYFAINNSHLQIYKQLQISGLITHVQADVINIEAIPFALRQHLFQTAFECVGHHHHHHHHQMNNDDVISDEDLELSEEAMAAHVMGMGLDSSDLSNHNHHSGLANNTACSSTSSKSSSSAASSGIGQILSADVLSPSTIEMLSKEMLIDETYEFGACENCVESEHEEGEDGEEIGEDRRRNHREANNNDEDDEENENEDEENENEDDDEDEDDDEYGNFQNGDYVRASNFESDDGDDSVRRQSNSVKEANFEGNFRLNLRFDNQSSLKNVFAENGTGGVQTRDVEIIKYLGQDDGKNFCQFLL